MLQHIPIVRVLERMSRRAARSERGDEAFKKVLEDSQLDKLAEWSGLPKVLIAESAIAPAAEQQEPWPLASLVGTRGGGRP